MLIGKFFLDVIYHRNVTGIWIGIGNVVFRKVEILVDVNIGIIKCSTLVSCA